MKKLLAGLASAAPTLRDFCAFGGLGLAAYGAHQVYPPAAFLLGGAGLFYLGVRGAR